MAALDYPHSYDVIVVGAGHAGCEAALAAARVLASSRDGGGRVLMLTGNLDSIGQMSCNPAVGGVGKGHLVKEIEALGGAMARVTDECGIQFRRLNLSKGPAVRATRVQCDKARYRGVMRRTLEAVPGLHCKQHEVDRLLVEDGRIRGVGTTLGLNFLAPAVIITTGTFLRGRIHVGDAQSDGDAPASRPRAGCRRRWSRSASRWRGSRPARPAASTGAPSTIAGSRRSRAICRCRVLPTTGRRRRCRSDRASSPIRPRRRTR